ncbi:hypothetical protein [Sporosarcina trichiuri]|uniref:hypothetical protein n=1 Tax=Sporosarcina trichiuri TaxID=3056445 RepID=UPI0025B5F62E|nr:hypothetical protein [Sporosarcina sp. 0.2-SM1T-5]WJY26113.1 hypothetical protein QWT68_08435 [Sporosarcina sp. 0.2-SM1T-5]
MSKQVQPDIQAIEIELQKVKEQDAVLAQIEERLYRMKDIAQFAAANDLDKEKAAELNGEIQDQLAAIERLKEDFEGLSELKLHGVSDGFSTLQ